MGDKLLSAVAQRLRGCIRSADLAYRIGGDEFALTITGHVDEEVCEGLKHRLDKIISRPFKIDDLIIQCASASDMRCIPTRAKRRSRSACLRINGCMPIRTATKPNRNDIKPGLTRSPGFLTSKRAANVTKK